MFARTPRLLLRPGWHEDAPALSRAIGEEAVVRNLSRAPWPYALGDAERFLAREADGGLPSLLITARTAGSPRIIGGIGLTADGPDGTVELGYWIARPYWGLGFATEAGQAIVALARDSLRLRRISAWHYLDNPASGHVLAKLGFHPSGHIGQRHSIARGRADACAHYVLELDESANGPMPLAA